MSIDAKRNLSRDNVRECVLQLHALKTLKRRLVLHVEQHERELRDIKTSIVECEDQIAAIENDLHNTARKSRLSS